MAILGSDRNNINIDGADTSFIDFGGNDTYTIIPSLFADVTITDNQASRIILPAGMDVSAANFSSNGVQFVVNGFTVTFIGNPALFSFVFGGTPIDPSVGTAKTFAQTAAAFGTTVPAPGAGTNAATQTGPIGLAGNVGQGPVLTTSASSVNEGGSVTLSISGAAANSVFDYTITGIEASDISLPLTGVFTTDADGAFTTPLSAFVDNEVEGTEVAVLTLDGTGRSVQLAISDANTTNQPPAVVSPVAIFGDEDTLLIGRIDATDVDGDTLTYSLTSLASSGTAAVDPTGGLTYNPNANFNGSDSFVVTINDGKGGVVTQTVNVTVVPVNDTPTVIPTLSLLGTSATTLSGEVGATDIDGDVLSYTVSNPAENGAVTVNDEGEIAYTPNADFTGGDTFEITVSDGNGGVVTQVVDVTVLPDSRTEGDDTFNIEFDYRFDTFGFFTPQVRQALEEAANIWESFILDDFPEFSTGQTFSVRNPETNSAEVITLNQPIDDLLIFVGSDVGFVASADAGPDGYDASGDINRLRIASDFRDLGPTTDFEPYIGSMRFNRDRNWNFELTEPNGNEDDFITVALHEIGHILGIGASSSFDALVATNPFDGMKYFIGPNATRQNSGDPVLLEQDQAHVSESFETEVLLDPFYQKGERLLPTEIDLAILADIGYQIAGYEKQGQPFELATDNGEIIFGREIEDFINGLNGDDELVGGNGNDQLLGGEGNDRLFGGDGNDRLFGEENDDLLLGQAGDDRLFGQDGNDELIGGDGNDILDGGGGNNKLFGESGIDTFVMSFGDGLTEIIGMDMINEVLIIDEKFGFNSSEEVLGTLRRPFSNVSELVLSDMAAIRIFDDFNTGERIGINNIRIEVLDMSVA